jgi:iron-only hydrogenase group A
MEFYIEVNSSQISVSEGETLLTALQRNGIKVPTLCHMNRFSPTGACRLCVVEVEGKRDLITSCSYPVEKNMKVLTNSQRVIKARKALVELLLSNHPDDCLYCQRNGNCELQWLAEEMNVKERKYFGEKNQYFPDHSAPSVSRDPAKCILCSRCVRVCEEIQLVTAIDFIDRSNKTTVNSAFKKGLNISSCINCGQCIMVCPTAALVDVSHLEKVQAALVNPKKKVIFVVSPSVTASLAEELEIKVYPELSGIIAAALKKCGAHRVYDLGFSCDINISNEAAELSGIIKNNERKLLLSSCCPSWIKYVETFRPEWKPMLSASKSPQQLMGSMIKFDTVAGLEASQEELFTVSVMPCVGKKFESSREEMTHKGISEIDAVLTIREFFRLIRTHGINMKNIVEESFDKPYDISSAAALKMGYSGGKAEAIALELHVQETGAIDNFKFIIPKNMAAKKESKVILRGRPIGFAWVSGIAEADEYISSVIEEQRSDVNYIEVMACPGGCAGGGGQPINRYPDKTKNRKKTLQEMEKLCNLKAVGLK